MAYPKPRTECLVPWTDEQIESMRAENVSTAESWDDECVWRWLATVDELRAENARLRDLLDEACRDWLDEVCYGKDDVLTDDDGIAFLARARAALKGDDDEG